MKYEDVVWAAGIFDGEGCASIKKLSRKTVSGFPAYTLELSVGVRRDRPLDMFTKAFGGSVGKYRAKDATQASHRWVVTGTNALHFLHRVLPFLRWKTEEAEVAVRFQEYVEHKKRTCGQGSMATPEENEIKRIAYEALRKLNHAKVEDW